MPNITVYVPWLMVTAVCLCNADECRFLVRRLCKKFHRHCYRARTGIYERVNVKDELRNSADSEDRSVRTREEKYSHVEETYWRAIR